MRLLGSSSPLSAFRWDLLYLLAELGTDERPGVAELAPPVQNALQALANERAAFEEAEDQAIIAMALLHKRDKKRDRLLITLGGIARATVTEIYERLFPKRNPSQTAKLGIDEESAEMARILGEIDNLPEDHPLREGYGKSLADAQAALLVAKTQMDKAETTLALQRSQLGRFKLSLDKLRLETHGKLMVLLKDKAEVEAFFRATTKAPLEEKAPAESPAQG